ncbi:Protein LSM14 A [Cyanidiococcus yangmingshanensis]|uniref:Protein LSM14 A n=1 Tax=Cyanidiococcus yangmingshanensis TaxID=2690220 RepID=A0A7J7IQD2_9RHOD|nr:Protein LSM14 A [Cyanidiococcus yangmingshanensis]
MNGQGEGSAIGAPPLGPPQFVGSRISLLSKMNVRYEGILYSINPQDSTVQLQNVRCYGTEDRIRPDRGPPIPPSNDVYDFIVFRGVDIQDLKVVVPAPMVSPPPPPHQVYPAGTGSGVPPSALIGTPSLPPYSNNAAPPAVHLGMGNYMWPGGGPVQMPPPPPYAYAQHRSDPSSFGQEFAQRGGYRSDLPPVQPGSHNNTGASLPMLSESLPSMPSRLATVPPPVPMNRMDSTTLVVQNGETANTYVDKDLVSTRPSQSESAAAAVSRKPNDTEMISSAQAEENYRRQEGYRSVRRGETTTDGTFSNGTVTGTEQAPASRSRGDRTTSHSSARSASEGTRTQKEAWRNASTRGRGTASLGRKGAPSGGGPAPLQNDAGSEMKTTTSHRSRWKPSELEEFDFESIHEKLQKSLLIEEDLLNKIREQPKKYDKNRSFFDSLGEDPTSQELSARDRPQIATKNGAQHGQGSAENPPSAYQRNVETFGEAAVRFRRHRGRMSGHPRQNQARGQGRSSNKRQMPPRDNERGQGNHQNVGRSDSRPATTA